MKGKVLDFSLAQSEGVISGDDGNRYTFQGKEWKSQAHPTAGARVDFDAEGKSAMGVYSDAPTKAMATAQSQNATVDDGLDERYKSIYCSSDDKILLGLCGGLAHKFGLPSAAMRIIFLIPAAFSMGLLYFVGIVLPKLPTKNVPRAA